MTPYYEQKAILDEYLLFHYGKKEEILPQNFVQGGPDERSLCFPQRSVVETFDLSVERGRALDLGCAVGAAAFELSRYFREVIGIDRSAAFIEAANRIRLEGKLKYDRVDQGQNVTPLTAYPPAGTDPTRISFMEGDAMDLPEELGQFDAVLMANLIDRLPDPTRCLLQIARFVVPGGQLVVTSPYTWRSEFTASEKWLGQTGDVLAEMKEVFAGLFSHRKTIHLPFLIREHSRKFQWSVAEATIWVRR